MNHRPHKNELFCSLEQHFCQEGLLPQARGSWAIRGAIALGVLVLIASAVDKTLWDWLKLLIVPVVLALGGYLFTRSENRRTQEFADRQRTLDREIADEQRTLDREIADQRRQDDMLQAYLEGMSQLLTAREAAVA